MMKKVLFGLTGLFLVSLFFVSCSSENDVLSHFSKRKYLKKFKDKNVKHKDVINEHNNDIDYAVTLDDYVSMEIEPTRFTMNPIEEVDNAGMVEIQEEKVAQLSFVQEPTKDYTAWNRYNRSADFSEMEATNGEINNLIQNQHVSSEKASEVLIAILCIFLPPVAVIVYEDTVTANFWVDLLLTFLFWLPGIIFAFLVCFGGVSV